MCTANFCRVKSIANSLTKTFSEFAVLFIWQKFAVFTFYVQKHGDTYREKLKLGENSLDETLYSETSSSLKGSRNLIITVAGFLQQRVQSVGKLRVIVSKIQIFRSYYIPFTKC